jgi:integrase
MTDSPDNFQTDLADRLYARVSPHSPDDQRLLLKLFETIIIHVDRTLSKAKKPFSPDLAAPKKYAAKDINKLVEQIRSGQPPELPKGKSEQHYRDPALPNLYIRLYNNTGMASWVVQYKQFGRQKKVRLGDVKVLDRLGEEGAIKAAKDLLAKVQLDRLDPQKAKRERMRANKVTFATMAPLFLEDKIRKGKGLRPSTVKSWKLWLITGYYFQPLHNLPIDEITTDQIQMRINDIASQSGNTTAIESCAAMRVFFKWARKKKKLPEGHPDPMIDIELPKENAPRERVLADDEIRLIWKTLEALEADAIHAQQIKASTGNWPFDGRHKTPDLPRAIMLLFLTGCRAQEIGDLQHSEIDLDNAELHIPKERIKTKNDLDNPLADWAVQILRRVERRPGRNNVFGHNKRNGLFVSYARQLINKSIDKAGGIPPKDWRLHDIRRTFRTHMAALKVSMDVGERLLGHVGHLNPIVRTYNRYGYWAEKRDALTRWETHLRAIIDGTAEKITYGNFDQRREGSPA